MLALAFSAGWAVNGWRLTSQQAKALEKLTEEMEQRLLDQAERTAEAQERLRLRETELLQRIEDTDREAEILRDEIENRPVVRVTERVEVPAGCPDVPVCATVDSLRYQDLYNRAATGTLPDPGTGN